MYSISLSNTVFVLGGQDDFVTESIKILKTETRVHVKQIDILTNDYGKQPLHEKR